MLQLNGIGLGTFPFANVFSPVSEQDVEAIVHEFLDLGGKYIDAGPLYGFGQVEEQLGRVLHKIPRHRYYISTKCGYIWGADKQAKISGKHRDVILECEKSLRRLGVEVIDLYMSHVPDTSTPFQETIGAMVELQRQGKIRDISVSNVSLEQLREYNRDGRVKYVQNRFSLLNQSLDVKFQSYCTSNNVGIIPYQVIERGLLTDKVLADLKLSQNDLRNRKPEFEPQRREVVAKWVHTQLRPIANKHSVSISTLAIWWALHQLAIALCVCGATSVSQVISNHKATSTSLPSHLIDDINDSYNIFEEEIRKRHSTSVIQFLGLS